MAGKNTRGVFQTIWKSFSESLIPNFTRRKLVGEDYLGTKYYETESRQNSIHKKPNRYFVPVNKDDFEQELPAEWEAWLRQRRKQPPTEEEVNANYQKMIEVKKNAAELDVIHAKEREAATESLSIGSESNVLQHPLDLHPSTSFPKYDEYREYGTEYKPKRGTK